MKRKIYNNYTEEEKRVSPTLINKVEELASKRYRKSTIAALVGVSINTLDKWLKRGMEDQANNTSDDQATYSSYQKLYEAFARGVAIAETGAVDRINNAGRAGKWEADAWYLERAFKKESDNYNKTTESKVDAQVSRYDSMTPEEINEAIIKLMDTIK